MRIPEPLFPLINLIVRVILQSPLHGLLSRSMMLVRVRGRKTGKAFAIPLRYIEEQGSIRCSTTKDTQWWKNVRANPNVILRIRGEEASYRACVLTDEPDTIRNYLQKLINLYPQDAVYHQIDLDARKVPDQSQLENALSSAVVVEAVPAPR